MGEWLNCYRINQRDHRFRAKVSEGGESYGSEGFKRETKLGYWLCENPENGHRWTCSPEAFEELYCEVGKTPQKKEKKQEDGHRKGKSRKRSSSHEARSSALGGGILFNDIEEEM